jgi:glycosyltransferase involved in cell wall biosynthesis
VPTLPTVSALPRLITEPYLLISMSLPVYKDAGGTYVADPLWVKDLREHLKYIRTLTLATPLRPGAPPPGMVPLTQSADSALGSLSVVELPTVQSGWHAVRMLPWVLARLFKAFGPARIVHAAAAGWPLPGCWYAAAIQVIRPRKLLLNVESAFWRIPPQTKVSLPSRWRADFFEWVNARCARMSDISFFTQQQYLESLLGPRRDRGHVIHASWIDADQVQASALVQNRWAHLLSEEAGPTRFLFAGRINREKGVPLLLEAAQKLLQTGRPFTLDILGDGPLKEELAHSVSGLGLGACVRFLGVLPYGAPFFEALGRYHAVVVPSITDEQPRIVYDAYARGVPVIASATAGLKDCVAHHSTGLLVPAGDVQALTDALVWAIDHRQALPEMAQHALARAAALTHTEMHRQRWAAIVAHLDQVGR